jgi:hypothetical protein
VEAPIKAVAGGVIETVADVVMQGAAAITATLTINVQHCIEGIVIAVATPAEAIACGTAEGVPVATADAATVEIVTIVRKLAGL